MQLSSQDDNVHCFIVLYNKDFATPTADNTMIHNSRYWDRFQNFNFGVLRSCLVTLKFLYSFLQGFPL